MEIKTETKITISMSCQDAENLKNIIIKLNEKTIGFKKSISLSESEVKIIAEIKEKL